MNDDYLYSDDDESSSASISDDSVTVNDDYYDPDEEGLNDFYFGDDVKISEDPEEMADAK